MGKYLIVVTNNIKNNLAYRANTFFAIISMLLSFGVLFYFWSSIYRQGNQVGTYSFKEIISYYAFVAIFEFLFTSGAAWDIGEEIKTGQVTNTVLKPIDHLKYKFFQSLGNLLYRIMFFAPVILAVVWILRNFITHPQNNFGYGLFILLALLAYVLNFLIYYIVGVASFWMIDNYGFFFACMVVISFVQGQWIPLDLLPMWFISLGDYLPFKYLFFVPIEVASGRTAFEFSMIIVPLCWSVSLYFLGKFLYKKGIKKYKGYGI